VGIGLTTLTAALEVQGLNAYASSANSLATSVSKAAFRVKGSSNASDSAWMGVETVNAYPYIQGANGTGSASGSLLLNPWGSNVGIGTTSPSALLHVNGAATFDGFVKATTSSSPVFQGFDSSDAVNYAFNLSSNGQAHFTSTVTVSSLTETSDQRFKKNITDANPQLADVTALGGKLRNWDWNEEAPVSEKDIRFLGLIAQEVESICPGIIHTVPRTKDGAELTPESTDEDGNVTPATYEQVDDSYKTIKTSVLIMKLLGAVTELSAKVAALEAA